MTVTKVILCGTHFLSGEVDCRNRKMVQPETGSTGQPDPKEGRHGQTEEPAFPEVNRKWLPA